MPFILFSIRDTYGYNVISVFLFFIQQFKAMALEYKRSNLLGGKVARVEYSVASVVQFRSGLVKGLL